MLNCAELFGYLEAEVNRYAELHPIAWAMFAVKRMGGARIRIGFSYEQTAVLLHTLKTAEENQADAERWRALLKAIALFEEQEPEDVVSDLPRKLSEFISWYQRQAAEAVT